MPVAPTLRSPSDPALLIIMDSKILIVIAVIAAVGGWLIVRALTPKPAPAPSARQAAAQKPPAAAQGKVTAHDRALPAVGGLGDAPAAHGPRDFDHDLAALVAALNEDQMIQWYVFSNPARHAKMPPALLYRRISRFWQGTTGVAR